MATIGRCVECKLDGVEVDEISYCKECVRKLEWQRETGRCGWCGRPVLECVCDDDFMEVE